MRICPSLHRRKAASGRLEAAPRKLYREFSSDFRGAVHTALQGFHNGPTTESGADQVASWRASLLRSKSHVRSARHLVAKSQNPERQVLRVQVPCRQDRLIHIPNGRRGASIFLTPPPWCRSEDGGPGLLGRTADHSSSTVATAVVAPVGPETSQPSLVAATFGAPGHFWQTLLTVWATMRCCRIVRLGPSTGSLTTFRPHAPHM